MLKQCLGSVIYIHEHKFCFQKYLRKKLKNLALDKKRCQDHMFQPHKLQLIPRKILQIHLEQGAEKIKTLKATGTPENRQQHE